MATSSSKKRKNPFARIKVRIDAFMSKRPHRTFRMTRRRDYVRTVKLPGYIALTKKVIRVFLKEKKHLLVLAFLCVALYALLVGVGSQQTYTSFVDTLQDVGEGGFEGGWGQIEKAGLLVATIATVGLADDVTEVQQIFSVLVALLGWLVAVWILRASLQKKTIKFRDALYNAGAPLISTFLIVLVILVQLIPLALAVLGYTAASSTNLLDGGVESMLFWVAAGGLSLISLFWVVSSAFSLIIITLPGMYPGRALSIAGDMMNGRRLAFLLRLSWMVLCIVIIWVIILIPVVLLEMWLRDVWIWVQSVPFVPVVVLLLTSLSLIWSSTYIYVLYREVIEHDEAK